MERIINLWIYALKNYAKFEGRACRMEAISFGLVQFIITTVLSIPLFIGIIVAANNNSVPVLAIIFGLILGLYGLATLIPSLALSARRLHDLNMSGWLLLLSFVPFVNSIVGIVFFVLLYFIQGTEGENNYGQISENY